MKDRNSKRRYPPKKCKQCTEWFTPTDARQEYCCPQHRIDFNNDQRRIREAPVRSIADNLKKNELVLIKAADVLSRLNQCIISMDMLLLAGYDTVVFSSSSVNTKTGNKVFWNINYGIEGCDWINKGFIIHKK